MYKFSKSSEEKLKQLHPDLQRLLREVIKHKDFTVIEGARTLERQKELLRTGKSKTLNSKHIPQSDGYSHAVDIIHYPIDWNDFNKNYMFVGFVRGIAASMGIKIRCGADWDGDFNIKDQSFHDLPHIELVK